jgi:hypothetical protein
VTLTFTPDATPAAEQLREAVAELERLALLAEAIVQETSWEERACWMDVKAGLRVMARDITDALRVRDARLGGGK